MMKPATSERNFVPSSTELGSPSSTGVGTAVDGQMLHGQTTGGGGVAQVVNVHVTVAAIAFPAASLTRGSVVPPFTVATYVLPSRSDATGLGVPARVVESEVAGGLV